jgi:hypothetical protein
MKISDMLRGKQVLDVLSNGRILQIRCEGGVELSIAWVDDANNPIAGRPVLVDHGIRILMPSGDAIARGR